MANADFGNQQQAGGFDASSYRAQQQQSAARALTPMQQKLAALEKALPAALKSSAAALAILIAVALVSVFGIGGAKLHAKYTAVENAVTTGVAADTQYGGDYTVAGQLTARANAAANVIAAAANDEKVGRDSAYVTQAQTALDALDAALKTDSPAQMYAADAALESAIDALYAQMQSVSATPLQMGAVQTQYSAFNSAGTVLSNLSYNALAQAYNEQAAGFPANMVGALWGCGKAELFA